MDLISPTKLNQAPYTALRDSLGKFYSIMHDGIQKFLKEFNGVFIRTLDSEFDIVNLPWALTNIPGGSMDHSKLVHQLISVITSIKKFRNPTFLNAESEFRAEFLKKNPDEIPPSSLPVILKCTAVEKLDFDTKTLELRFDEWPVAVVGDGCSVNPKAVEYLSKVFGLISPGTICSGHSAVGSIRRMSTSKTMQVEAVVKFAEGIRPVLRHFQLSGKSSSLLNDALLIMEMKQLKTITWSPTRMGNIITSSKRTVEILFPLVDTLTSTNIKPEESAYFLTPTCQTLLHLMADLEPVFMQQFLRRLDTNDATLFEVFGLTEAFVDNMEKFESPCLDKFISGLKTDDYGNIIYDSGENSIVLNCSHHPTRRSMDRLPWVKSEKKVSH